MSDIYTQQPLVSVWYFISTICSTPSLNSRVLIAPHWVWCQCVYRDGISVWEVFIIPRLFKAIPMGYSVWGIIIISPTADCLGTCTSTACECLEEFAAMESRMCPMPAVELVSGCHKSQMRQTLIRIIIFTTRQCSKPTIINECLFKSHFSGLFRRPGVKPSLYEVE